MGTRRDSRQLILAAAGKEFGSHGFAGARVDRIAASAGVNKQLIFYYFGSKTGLFGAILASVVNSVSMSAGAGDDAVSPLEQLRGTIRRVWEALGAHAGLVRAALFASPGDGAAQGALSGALRPVADRIMALVSRGQGLGYLRDDLAPDAIAAHVLATAIGYISLDPVLSGPQARQDRGAAIELVMRTLTW